METTIFFITIALFTTAMCLPVHQPQDVESFILLPPVTADAAPQQLQEFSPEEAVELLDPAQYDLSVPAGGETMETAANMVFRPLFSYRKIQEQRKRLYGGKRSGSTTSSPNSLRRSQVYYSQPGRYVYSQNYQGYPYYRNAPYYNSK